MNLKLIGKFSVIIILLAFTACEKDYDGYYDMPDNLEGPIYEQLKSNENFSSYVDALERVPKLQVIVNKSGLYTVFAPTNDAWTKYLHENNYASTEDIPPRKLQELVENHILFGMWFRYDFDRFISEYKHTRIDETSFEVRSRPDLIPVIASKGSLVDDIGSAAEGSEVKVYHDFRQSTVYTSKYLDKLDVKGDYKIIYGKDASDFNFGDANVSMEKISAKNGVIHGIDKVVAPADLISTYMSNKDEASLFYQIVESFMELDYSEEYSKQYGSDVYILQFVYPTGTDYTATSNLWGTNRSTWGGDFKYSTENEEISVFLPTNESLTSFLIEKYIPNFTKVDDIPQLAKYYIVGGSTCRYKALWPSDIDGSFSMTGDSLHREVVLANPNTEIEILSNGISYLGDFIPSRKLNSVLALTLLDKSYEWTGHALLNILPEEERTILRYGVPMMDVLSSKSDAIDGKFTYLTPSNVAWENYGFTWENFKSVKPSGSIMTSLTSPKLWTILKSHALMGEYSLSELEAGTLPNGFYLTASRLYQKYKNGKFLGYNRNVNKVEAYIPNLVGVIPETGNQEKNGAVVGVDGLLDLHINRDNSFFNLAENKKAESDLSYKPFMDKCNEVHFFEDGEIDYKDDFKVQNLTVFVLTPNAITEYNQVISGIYSALPNKASIDSLAWCNNVWRNTIKGHFVWNATDSYRRLFIDADNYTGVSEKYYTEGNTFYKNSKLNVSYEGGKAFISRDGVVTKVEIGIDQDGNSLGTENTSAVNEQCMNAVVHIVDRVLPLPGLE